MPKDTSILTIPSDPSYLSTVGAYVVAAAAKLGFDDRDTGDIRLAVDEACTHVIQSAFDPEEEQDLTTVGFRDVRELLNPLPDPRDDVRHPTGRHSLLSTRRGGRPPSARWLA